MTDIVERARARNMPFGHLELIDKLADEIERLRGVLQTCRNTAQINLKVAQDRGAEIDRLQIIVKTAANNLDSVGAHHYASWCRLSLEEAK